MNILNIGPIELVTILLLAFVILGPKDMIATGRKLGLFVRKVTNSDIWRSMQTTSKKIQEMPEQFMKETGLQDDLEKLETLSRDLNQQMEVRIADEEKTVSDPHQKPDVSHIAEEEKEKPASVQ